MFVEDPDGDEQMGDVDQPEDKQQSETFGESDEKLVSRVFLGLLPISLLFSNAIPIVTVQCEY